MPEPPKKSRAEWEIPQEFIRSAQAIETLFSSLSSELKDLRDEVGELKIKLAIQETKYESLRDNMKSRMELRAENIRGGWSTKAALIAGFTGLISSVVTALMAYFSKP